MLLVSNEVDAALSANHPVVALESTVIAHGLPYPENLKTARACEDAVRDHGVVPATIAVFDGEFRVGLRDNEINLLATESGFRKISRRDLPIAVAKKLNCATTVSTTMNIANRAGIRVFATGGIGGVHRGYYWDVSADMVEMTKTPTVVVCSGAKIVLDLPATREWLETYGITVLGWKCDEMPAFYSRTSGLPVDERVDSAEEVAKVVAARDAIGFSNAILVTVPVPEAEEIDKETLENWVAEALQNADKNNISGKEITPFLLGEMAKRSDGRTLAANIALLKNNAAVAAEIATAICSLP